MKIKNIFLSALTLICLLGFSGCKDNDDPVGDPYLTFENIEGTINVSKDESFVAQFKVADSTEPGGSGDDGTPDYI